MTAVSIRDDRGASGSPPPARQTTDARRCVAGTRQARRSCRLGSSVSATDGSLAIDRAGLDELFGALERRGYTVVGPTVRDRAIVLDELDSTAELPAGWTDVQEGGTYRLARRDDDALFGHNAGPELVEELPVPVASCGSGPPAAPPTAASTSTEDATPPPRYAFIGVRSCDLHAIAIQDRVFLGGRLRRPGLPGAAARAPSSSRSTAARPAATCFCVSMDTGPKATAGYDLALTELLEDGGHRFVVEVGSERGAEVLAELPRREAAAARAGGGRASDRRTPPRWADAVDRHGRHQGPALPQPRAPALGRRRRPLPDLRQLHDGVPHLLLHTRSRTSPTWPARRPSARGSGTRASRSTTPTSTAAASHASTKARYRQWMTHKLATWIDQFGTLGLRRLRALHRLVPGGDRHHRGGGRDPRDRPRRRGERLADADDR